MFRYLAVFFFFVFSSQVMSAIDLGGQQYLRLNTPQGGKKIPNFLLGEVSTEGALWSFNYKAEANFRFYPGTTDLLYSFPEFFADRRVGPVHLYAGRRILDWAPAERFWLLGEINPLRGFNLLEKKQEGNTGLLADFPFHQFLFSAIVSYVNIPQINPTYKIHNGVVKAPNEWSKLPPARGRYNGQEMPIYYNLIDPQYEKIFFRPTLGGRVQYKWQETGGVQLFALYKPEPIVRFNATGYYEQNTVEQATVFTRPFVNKHLVAGLDAFQELFGFKLRSGFWHVNPDKGTDPDFSFTALRIEPTYKKDQYFYFNLSHSWSILKWEANFIELLTNENKVDDLFAKTAKWQRALGTNVVIQLNETMNFDIDLRHDFITKDQTIKGDFYYNFMTHWRGNLGLEIIDSPDRFSYWYPYRSNDSFYLRFDFLL